MKTFLIEYDSGTSLDYLVSYGTKMPELLKAVDTANQRISKSLKIDRNVLSIKDGNIKASGVAGVIRLTSNIEVEIIPKFISTENDSDWRKTLYLLSALSKHGNILANERIKSSSTVSDSLYDMAGRMLADEYISNKRKPLRKYRKENFVDYCIDGEILFESYFDSNPSGTLQSRVKFDKKNNYNATIKMAMEIVLPYISDSKSRNIISKAMNELGSQKYIPGVKQKVPSRNHEWSQAYSLSYDIVQGLGSSFDEGNYFAPGFVANTWQMWEWLITVAIQIGSSDKKVYSQYTVNWGTKTCGDKEYSVNVFPDVVVYEKNSDTPLYLADAKYKLLVNEKTGEIDRADLYEAFAFCNSLSAKNIFLMFPKSCEENEVSGEAKMVSRYDLPQTTVFVLRVALGGINEKGGIYAFSKNLVESIETIISDINT